MKNYYDCKNCYDCTHFDSYNKRCRIGSDCNDCDDFEINDHYEEDDN